MKERNIPEALVSLENALPGLLGERERGKQTHHHIQGFVFQK